MYCLACLPEAAPFRSTCSTPAWLPARVQVLSIFPTTIRRRILQYLYMRHLRNCYLFGSCPQRFLDALLASARVEVFMPGGCG
jgi:hypothetical protein